MTEYVDTKKFQDDVATWAFKNFPKSKPYHPLLGALEELGELAHAHLKDEQRIRGDAERHHADKLDAVGDVVIYLADYCWRNGLNLQNCINLTWDKVRQRDWTKHPTDGGDNE